MIDRRILLGIILFFTANLFQAAFTPITEDEAYYWVWSQKPAWGYFDHPPMIAWWIAAGYSLFKSTLGVRLMTVVLNSFALFILARTLKVSDKKQLQLFWLIFGSVIVINVFGFIATPDAPLLFFTLLYPAALKVFLEKQSLLSAVLLGILLAALMYSKYHAVLLIGFTLIPIVKHLWKNPKFYIAAAIAVFLYTPHLYWLTENDFIPLSYHFIERSTDETFELRKLNNYLLYCAFGCAPLLSWFVWKSIFKFKPVSLFEKSLWWLAVLPLVFFFFTIFKDNVQPQWLLISFIAMAVLTWIYYSNRPVPRIFILLGCLGLFLILIFRIVLMLPGISPLEKFERFGKNTQNLQTENAVFEKYQEASLYMYFNPDKKAAVHRTLGNRHNQFTLWKSEDAFAGKEITYISPWIKGDRAFIGFKNRTYSRKDISDFLSYDHLEIEVPEKIRTEKEDRVIIPIEIENKGENPLVIGGDSELQLNISFYQKKHHQVLAQIPIPLSKTVLRPGEKTSPEIQFKNTMDPDKYKAVLGLDYLPIGTTYASKPIEFNVD